MKLICIDPTHDPRWRDLVNQLDSSVFHSPQWMCVLKNTYHFAVKAYLLLDEREEPVAGLPFCRLEDLKQERIISLPFCDYCDPLVTTPDHWRMMVTRVLQENCTFAIRCLHNPIGLTDERLTVVNRAKWHGLCLCEDEEILWAQLHNSARRAIRKAQNSEIIVKPARNRDDLRAFYELHLRIRKQKYRLLAQPYQFFESIWEQFIVPGFGELLLAYDQNEIVAGVLLLVWKDKLYYKFNASTTQRLSCRPNDLLLWEAIKYAKNRKLNYFDFGLSDWDQEGLIRYKQKYASDESTISFLRHTTPDSPSIQEEHLHALLPQLTELLTDEAVPEHITEQAGDLLYRCFS